MTRPPSPRHFKSGGDEHYLCWRGSRYLVIEWWDGTWSALVFDPESLVAEVEVERALEHGGPAGEYVRRGLVPWTGEHEALWDARMGP